MIKAISKLEAEAMLKKNISCRFVDIRSAEEYANVHLPDAVNIPSEQLNGISNGFSKTDVIICICNHGQKRSQSAAELLNAKGFENSFYLEGGISGWFDAE